MTDLSLWSTPRPQGWSVDGGRPTGDRQVDPAPAGMLLGCCALRPDEHGRPGGQLKLAAGHDLTYHHGLELVFGDPVFVSCPSAFHDPTFRAPSPDELLRVTRQLGETPHVVVAFEADAGGQELVSCLIAAERLDIVKETVLRYRRVDAGPDQRFAPWVRSPDP